MKNGFLSRREEIILTTINLIHELGIHNISMKDIGRREGVTEASLYKHFKSKEEILLCVLEYYEKYDNYIYKTIQEKHSTVREKILLYFNMYGEYYNNYKEITSLVRSCDTLLYDKSFTDKIKHMVGKKTAFLTDVIKKGQKKGELKTSITAENFAFVLLGTFDKVVSMWRMGNYTFLLNDRISEIMGDILTQYKVK